jgi:hypothetical protein
MMRRILSVFAVSMVVVPALSQSGVPMSDITNCFAPPVVDPMFVSTIVGK